MDGSTDNVEIWRPSKNKNIFFASQDDFLEAQWIPEDIRKTYLAYVETTDPKTLKENDKGYIDTDWSAIDSKNRCQYRATYNQQYGFGVMKLPAPKATADAHTKEYLERIEKKLNVLALHFGIKFDSQ